MIILIVVTSIFLLIIQRKINIINKKLSINWTDEYHIKLEEIRKKVSVCYGKFYAYNSRRKCLVIQKKDLYTLYDCFALNHEFGHHIDNENSGGYRGMVIIAIFRLIILPIAFLIIFCGFLGTDFSKKFIYAYEIFFGLSVLYKIIYILIYENRANQYAYEVVKKEFSNKWLKLVKQLICCIILQQLMITIETTLLVFGGIYWCGFEIK